MPHPRTKFLTLALVAAIFSTSTSATAQTTTPTSVYTGRGMAALAFAGLKQNSLPPLPQLGDLQLDIGESNWINAADGRRLMLRPGSSALSINNQPNTIDSSFYKPKPRAHIVMHYAGRKVGEVMSFGLDSGYEAAKLSIKPALFLGYARSFSLVNHSHYQSYFTFAVGGWLGGQMQHRPCVDEENREYYCGGAIISAWSDFRQPDETYSYSQVVFTHEF